MIRFGFHSMGLRSKLVFQTIILILLAVNPVQIVNQRTATRLYGDQIYNAMRESTLKTSDTINAWLLARKTEIELLASLPEARIMDWKQQRQTFVDAHKKLPTYLMLFISDTNGDYNTTLDASGNIADRDYFVEALNGKTAISDPVVSKSTGKTIIAIASPIRGENGDITGILVGTVPTDGLMAEIIEQDENSIYQSYIVNKDGLIIAHPDSDKVLNGNITDLVDGIESNAVLSNAEGIGKFGTGKDKHLTAYNRIEFTGWSVVQTAPEREIYAPLNKSTQLNIIIVAVIIAISALLVFYFSRVITEPVMRIQRELHRIAEGGGDLTAQIAVQTSDEMGDLARSFNRFIASLRGIVTSIDQISTQLKTSSKELSESAGETYSASTQVSNTVEEIASGTQRQVSSVSNTKSSIDQVAARAKSINAMLADIAKDIQAGADLGQNGNALISNAYQSVTTVSATIADARESIQGLAKKSDDIQSVVDLITEIADQTNLLALNAAIESARAGEHGRGFAVVAEEVRKLAEKSAHSTKEIAELIGTVRKDIIEAVDYIDNSMAEMNSTTELAEKAGTALTEIADTSSIAVKGLEKLIDAANEIVKESEGIQQDIRVIAEVSEGASAATQEVAATTEEQNATIEQLAENAKGLNELANKLSGLINRFTV